MTKYHHDCFIGVNANFHFIHNYSNAGILLRILTHEKSLIHDRIDNFPRLKHY